MAMRSARIGMITWGALVWSAALSACTDPDTADPAQASASHYSVVATLLDRQSDNTVLARVELLGTAVASPHYQRLPKGAALACNDAPLTWDGLGYAVAVPRVAPGGLYVVSYELAGVRSTVEFPAEPGPVITSPIPGAHLAAVEGLVIRYERGSGAFVRPSVAGPSRVRSGAEQGDEGSAAVDASELGSGPGSVSLTRELHHTSIVGQGFQPSSVTYTVATNVAVVWD